MVVVVEVAAGVLTARSVRTVVDVVVGAGVSTTVVHEVNASGAATARANIGINFFILVIRETASIQPYAVPAARGTSCIAALPKAASEGAHEADRRSAVRLAEAANGQAAAG